MQLVGYIFFLLLIGIFAILPFSLMYLFSNFVAFTLHRVVGYRKSVILKNLTWAFPDLSENEKQKLLPKIYRNFSDIVLESLKGSTYPYKAMNKRHKFIASDKFKALAETGEGNVVFAAHYANWEWATITLNQQVPFQVIGLIKPLRNKYIHKFIERLRSKTKTGLVSIYGTKEALYRDYDQPTSIVYLSDQNPSNKEKAHRIIFFGKEALALQGASIFASEHPNRPVWYFSIHRKRRGFYEVHPILLADNTKSLNKPEELTQTYFNALEEQIRAKPENWIWSHKRWKGQIQY